MGDEVNNNRIDKMFIELAQKREKALITYIMAGDPNLQVTESLVKALASGGSDLIELGVPFSDPLADGPSIQRASQRSLADGTTLSSILELVAKLRTDTQIPIVLMSYYNPILKFGIEQFVEKAAASEIDGVIVPDLPLEESGRLADLLGSRGKYLIPLLAPTSTGQKIGQVAQRKTGFVYCVSLTGVTGAREELPLGVYDFLQRVRKNNHQPIAVGFGISKPEQARKISEFCDGVIVGSAIVNLVEKYQQQISVLEEEIKQFVGTLKASLKSD